MTKRFVATLEVHYEFSASDIETARTMVKEGTEILESEADNDETLCAHVQDLREITPGGDNYIPQEAKERAISLWTERVYNQGRLVDEFDQHEWETLAYGFFLACGFVPSEARLLTAEVSKRDLL